MKYSKYIKFKMADNKRIYKCSLCHEIGHNKAKCSKKVTESKPKPTAEIQPLREIYEWNMKVDIGNGGVDEYGLVYASIDGLVKGLEECIRETEEEHNHPYDSEEEEEDEEEEEEEDEYSPYKGKIFYYSEIEKFKNVPIPTKEYIEKFLSEKHHQYDGLLIKIGRYVGGADYFGCEISVSKRKVNP